MKWLLDCVGCSKKLWPTSSAMQATSTDDAGVETSWIMCEACIVRCQSDKAFAAQVDAKHARSSGSI